MAVAGDVTVVRLRDQGAEGPCSARNRALREASSTWVFLIDSDAEPEDGCLERMLQAARARPSVALISPRVILEGPPRRVHYDGGEAHFLGELCLSNHHASVEGAAPPSRSPGAAASTALLIHRRRALECGGFDEDLVFFREDLDFTLRLRAGGWTLAHCPEAQVLHRRARASRGVLHGHRRFYQTRNRWWLIFKLWEARTIALTFPWQLAYEALNAASAVAEGELGQWTLAFVDLLRRRADVLRSRRRFQARRRLRDRELLGAPALTWRPENERSPWARVARRCFGAACAAAWSLIGR